MDKSSKLLSNLKIFNVHYNQKFDNNKLYNFDTKLTLKKRIPLC